MGRRLTLILGGARSGKSDFAQALAQKRGGAQVLFVATAQALDDEMQARIHNHQAGRDTRWVTLEAPRAIANALRSAPLAHIVLLDCMTLWVSNVLLAEEFNATASALAELEELLAWHRASDAELIVVSNEVGMGLVPPSEMGRAYRDLLGAVNRKLAGSADEVFLLVAGLPIEVKSRTVQLDNL